MPGIRITCRVIGKPLNIWGNLRAISSVYFGYRRLVKRGANVRVLMVSISTIGFLLSLISNFATWVGFNPVEEIPGLWFLHILALGLNFVLVAAIQRRYPKGKRDWNRITQTFPERGRLLLKITFVYALVNFGLSIVPQIGLDFPVRLNGVYALYRVDDSTRVFINTEDGSELDAVYLENLPTLRRVEYANVKAFYEISEQEYYHRGIPMIRAFTGLWMLFFAMPALFYAYGERKLKRVSTA